MTVVIQVNWISGIDGEELFQSQEASVRKRGVTVPFTHSAQVSSSSHSRKAESPDSERICSTVRGVDMLWNSSASVTFCLSSLALTCLGL